jgi:hypothetical protein
MLYIGIDPGLSGGIALVRGNGQVFRYNAMPKTERDVWLTLADWKLFSGRAHATIEFVSASPQMGVTSAFTFGKGYGGLLMLLTALDIPFDQITPRKWQTAMGCLSGGDKNVTKRRAQQLFPKLTITHAIADALLLAEFCRRVRGSEYGQEEEPDTEPVKEAREGGESIAQQDSEQGHAQSTGEASPIREDRDRSRPPARSARRRAARHGGSTRQGAR